jgi:hypothetical protein
MVQQPHPAVVRIIAPEADSTSYGSGSLIAVNEYYGIVITNWHVVRDATRQIWVVFPGGFQSPATIMKVDRDWDFAALLIFKPNVQPLPISTQAPQLGERLTIAGYGSGWFRAASGVCLEYFSPGGDLPKEIVELSTPARNGDSGGPIFNDRGEIAGVLFGTDGRSTMGSYCGQLRRFLAPLGPEFDRLPPPAGMAARQNPNPPVNQIVNQSANLQIDAPQNQAVNPAVNQSTPIAAAIPPANTVARAEILPNDPPKPHKQKNRIPSIAKNPPPTPTITQVTAIDQRENAARPAVAQQFVESQTAPAVAKTASSPVNAAIPSPLAAVGQDTIFDQLKSFLAVIGILALFIQGLKILGKSAA